MLDVETRVDGAKILFFERMIFDRFKIDPEKFKWAVWLERVCLLGCVVLVLYTLRGLALLAFGAVITVVVFEDAYKRVVYDSGITNIPAIMNFINFFVPHVGSGNSADQSLLGYIEYSRDVELAAFYENRNDPNFKLQPHLRQIVDIYDIAKYNEDKGISDYTYIMDEISRDYAQKQVYYNNFVARMGEIKPIVLSYYFGVPALIVISWNSTRSFWFGIWGYVVAIIVLLLFISFRFLIYKLQKDTVKNIF